MAESDTILQLGIDAAREGNREEARNLFSLLTRQEPNNLQAWLWLAGVAESPEERRTALEQVLVLDPTNDMAIKGLQNMGVAPAAAVRPSESFEPVSEAPVRAPAVEMTDEERYAAELDSAFDDYDSVPKIETPARREPDLDLEEGAAPPPAEPRMSARQRSAARRTTTTPIHSGGDDDDDDIRAVRARRSGGGGGSNNTRTILISLIALIAIVLLVFWIFWPRGNGGNTAEAPTAPVAAETPGAGGDAAYPIAPTETVSATGMLTNTSTPTTTEALTTTETLAPTPAAAADVSGANPQPVDIGAVLESNGWSFTFPGICLGSCGTVVGPQIGGLTSQQGNYVVVLVLMSNNTGANTALPANFFVLKDAQGKIYEAQPQASSAYVQRGINADLSMEDQIPANGIQTSIPLVFDVPHGASNLMLFARSKTDQGWVVLNSVP